MAGRIEVGGVRPAEQMQTELRKSQRELNSGLRRNRRERLQAKSLPPAIGENADDLRRNISENSQMLRRLREELADLPRTAKMRRSACEERDQQKLESEAAALDAKLRAVLLAGEIAELERTRDRHRLDEADLIAGSPKNKASPTENVQAYLRMTKHPTEDPGGAASFPTTSTASHLTNLEMDNPIERVKVMKAPSVRPRSPTTAGPFARGVDRSRWSHSARTAHSAFGNSSATDRQFRRPRPARSVSVVGEIALLREGAIRQAERKVPVERGAVPRERRLSSRVAAVQSSKRRRSQRRRRQRLSWRRQEHALRQSRAKLRRRLHRPRLAHRRRHALPSLHRTFRRAARAGLSELLGRKATFDRPSKPPPSSASIFFRRATSTPRLRPLRRR